MSVMSLSSKLDDYRKHECLVNSLDSFAIVNPFIAWRNHILRGKSEKAKKHLKYGIRQARLSLIQRWG